MTIAPWLFLWRLDIILTSPHLLFKLYCSKSLQKSNSDSFCTIVCHCTPFVFPLSKFSNLISIPFKVIFLILLYSLCCPIHYIKYSIHSYSFPFLLKILRCSIGLALVMVTGGWKASNIFSFSPSFLFVFLLLEGEYHHSIFNFLHVIVLFWWKTSSINLQFSFFIPSCFLFW